MKRIYTNSKNLAVDDANFFTGVEVEQTPAYGLNTLFIIGLQSSGAIWTRYPNTTHLFFGANHSFNVNTQEEFDAWEKLIIEFLDLDVLCSLDIPLNSVPFVANSKLNGYNNFIPQIRIPIPHVQNWNYNTMVKIDDSGFNKTNPGVWTHSLHDLKDRTKFTNWSAYKDDSLVE